MRDSVSKMRNFYILVLSLVLQGIVHCKEDQRLVPFDKIWKVNTKVAEKFSGDPEEESQPELFEGDIVVTDELKRDIENLNSSSLTSEDLFDAITGRAWPNAEVPYQFARGFRGRNVVHQAIAHYKKYTCIRWVPRTNQRSYVTFFHGGGCYSMIGRQGGPQRISLGHGCLRGGIGVTVHEMMHALGFYHEQSRRDRNRYIRINFQNISPRMRYNFEMYRSGQASTLREPYDKRSVMHYGNYAFSINGRKTIVSLSNPNERLGQRQGLSKIDINQLRKYYRCSGTTRPQPTSRPTSSCKDYYSFCTVFRGSHKKWCAHRWLTKYCKTSCGKCATKPKPKPEPTSCVDKNIYCRVWARLHCRSRNQQYRVYMEKNCRKSCGFCTG